MRKLKVAHIITMLELGGAQGNTLYTVRHLDRTKFDVLLICGKGGILDEEARSIKDIKLYFVPTLIRHINPLYDILAFFHLFFILLKERPTIVHTHSSKAGILGRLSAWLSRRPLILHTFHGFGFNPYQRPFVRRTFILAEKLAAVVTTKFIAVSKDNIYTAVKLGIKSEKDYILIRSGIEMEKFMNVAVDVNEYRRALEIDDDDKVVVTVGPFKKQKNLGDYIEVASIVSSRMRNVKLKFLLIGDGVLREMLEKKVKLLNLEEVVKFLSWRRDVPQIFKLSTLFVLTSLWEGLPRAAVEALVSGLPVVAYDVDGLRDIIINGVNGYRVKVRDKEALAEKIVELLTDKNKYMEMCENAKRSINYEEFDIRSMVRQQEKLYLQLVNEKIKQ